MPVGIAVEHHQAWLEAERDTMGFARVPTAYAKRMVEWLQGVDPDGTAKVEVRRYSGGFLHGKTYLVEERRPGCHRWVVEHDLRRARAQRRAEPRYGWRHEFGGEGARVVRALLGPSDPYDLAGLYGRLWDPHTPWSVYLRMLWELYGEHLELTRTPIVQTGLNLTRFQADGVARMERLSTSTAASSSQMRSASARHSSQERSSTALPTSTGSASSSLRRRR